MSALNAVSLAGLLVYAVLAWVLGGCRRDVPWRTVAGAFALLLATGAAVFLAPPARTALVVINDLVVAALGASGQGVVFLFGPLALGPGMSTSNGEASVGFIFATQVLPAVVFFAALMAALYHLRVIQPLVRAMAWVFHRTLGLSGVEALAGASNVFVGVESATTVKPYLERMTRSELLTMLTCCMATVASTTLALYVLFLGRSFPQIAGHLVSASVVSIPAAVLVSKLVLPEREHPETLGAVPADNDGRAHESLMGALAGGAWDGIKLAAGIAGLLVAVLGVVGLIDLALGALTRPWESSLGGPLSVSRLLGWLFVPLVVPLGIEGADLMEAARLLGGRFVLTEVWSYRELGMLAEAGSITPRTLVVLSYALCGFAHVASAGIFVGGIGALAPARREDLARLAPLALAAATLATLMTGALAGVFWTGGATALGLVPG